MNVLAAFLSAAIAAALLSHAALRIGWIDQLSGQEYRKLRKQPVALVGGAAIFIGVFVAVLLSAVGARSPWATFSDSVASIAWPALLAAFLVGFMDDLVAEGLTARIKFAGQLLVAALVAWYPGSAFADASAWECIGLGLLALVAMNAVNLFDHADGLAGLLCAVAMLVGAGPTSRLFAGAAAGYLPFNLFFRRAPGDEPLDVGQERARSAPYAMLGDSGSHVVGVLLATTPGAWWFLALPLVDMARVVLGRIHRGRPFWRGDRTHIGHLLEDIGFSPITTAMLVGTALLPPLVTIALMDGPAPLAAGLLAGAALYFGMLVMTDGVLPPGGPGSAVEDVSPGLDPDRAAEDAAVSDVFARASGTARERSRPEGSGVGSKIGRHVLKPRKGLSQKQNSRPRDGIDTFGSATPAGRQGSPGNEPRRDPERPSEGLEGPSGPFAQPLVNPPPEPSGGSTGPSGGSTGEGQSPS